MPMGEKGHSAGEHSLQRRPTACCPTPGGHRCRAGALGALQGAGSGRQGGRTQAVAKAVKFASPLGG